jgi:hypothetical protein
LSREHELVPDVVRGVEKVPREEEHAKLDRAARAGKRDEIRQPRAGKRNGMRQRGSAREEGMGWRGKRRRAIARPALRFRLAAHHA